MNVTENCVICHDLGTLQWMDLCWGGWSWVCDDQDWELRIRHRQMDSQRLIQRNKNLKAGWQPKSHPFFCHILLMSASLRGPKKRYFLWSLEVFAHQKVSPLSPRRSRRQISTRSSIWNSNERKRPSVPSCPNRSTPNGFWMNMILPQWLAVPPWESCNKQQLDFWFSTFFWLFGCLFVDICCQNIDPTNYCFPLRSFFWSMFLCSSYKVLFPSSKLEDSNKDVQRYAGATGRFSTGRFSSCPNKTQLHVTPAPKPSPASRLPALGRIKWKGPSLPENYMPPGGISKGLVQTARPRQESEELVAQWRWQDANASFLWLVVSRSCFFLFSRHAGWSSNLADMVKQHICLILFQWVQRC